MRDVITLIHGAIFLIIFVGIVFFAISSSIINLEGIFILLGALGLFIRFLITGENLGFTVFMVFAFLIGFFTGGYSPH